MNNESPIYDRQRIADSINNDLKQIDLTDGNILKNERSILTTLARSLGGKEKSIWLCSPIAPLAEPTNLDELVGDNIRGTDNAILSYATRLDRIYEGLANLNNHLTAEIEAAEKAVVVAADAISDIGLFSAEVVGESYWIGDSFNSTVWLDSKASNITVDTDYGHVTLPVAAYETITQYTLAIDRENSKGIPGSNLQILNRGTNSPNTEPIPVLETRDTRNLNSLVDGDPASIFEIERNFIPPEQKLSQQGRAFVTNESGTKQKVLEVTKNLDWHVIVSWPDGTVDAGPEGKGVSLAEFTDPASNLEGSRCVLSLVAFMDTPTELSNVKILPFIRAGEPLRLKRVSVLLEGHWVDIASDVDIGHGINKSASRLQADIYRRTGIQTVGTVLNIPSNRLVSAVKIELDSPPVESVYGLAHAFQDVQKEHRTERNHGLWRSVDKWRSWTRYPINEKPPELKSEFNKDKIAGSIVSLAQGVGQLAQLSANIMKNPQAASALGSGFPAVAKWLGKAMPYVGALLLLDAIVGGLFAVKRSETVKQVKVGYDIFKGYRAAVALRDLSFLKLTYGAEGTVQSVKREFSTPVTRIGIFAEDSVPEEWGSGDWIVYSISVDGTTWIDVNKLTDVTLDKSVKLDSPTTTVYLRARIKGNPSDPYHSPVIKHWSAQGVP